MIRFGNAECEGRAVRIILTGNTKWSLAVDLAALSVGRYANAAVRDAIRKCHAYRVTRFEQIAGDCRPPWKLPHRSWVISSPGWVEFLERTSASPIRAEAISSVLDDAPIAFARENKDETIRSIRELEGVILNTQRDLERLKQRLAGS